MVLINDRYFGDSLNTHKVEDIMNIINPDTGHAVCISYRYTERLIRYRSISLV